VNPRFDLFARRPFLIYPYTARTNLTDRRASRTWRTLARERAPEARGPPRPRGPDLQLHRQGERRRDVLREPSIKYADVAYRGAWVALGVEFNFPVSHNWATVSPVDFGTVRHEDGSASVWVGTIDRPYGMQWRVELRLRPGRSLLEQTTTLYNRSDVRHRFYWWTTASVRADDDSRILYPMEFSASHHFADVDTWPVDSSGRRPQLPPQPRRGASCPASSTAAASRSWASTTPPRSRGWCTSRTTTTCRARRSGRGAGTTRGRTGAGPSPTTRARTSSPGGPLPQPGDLRVPRAPPAPAVPRDLAAGAGDRGLLPRERRGGVHVRRARGARCGSASTSRGPFAAAASSSGDGATASEEALSLEPSGDFDRAFAGLTAPARTPSRCATGGVACSSPTPRAASTSCRRRR
jgi:hypothetical protein